MTIEQIKSEFEKEFPQQAKTLNSMMGEKWHLEWSDPYSAGDEYISFAIALWIGFHSGYVKAEHKHQR